MRETVVALLAWISLQFGVEAPVPPAIEFVSQQRLAELAYGGNPPSGAAVTALYNRTIGTVYLSTEWKKEDLRDRSTLVHELVHHCQERGSIPYPCIAARERDAYRLQADWLRQQGVSDPHAFMGVDAFTIAVISMCRDE
jgi:hypothetical protein